MGKMMLKLNNNLAKGSSLQGGDIKTLKLIMSALKTVKDDGVDIQFTIDQLQETITYMEQQGMGKVDPLEKKLADVRAGFENAQKDAPWSSKTIKPTQEAEAAKVIAEIEKMGEDLEDKHKKQLRASPYKIATGASAAYTELNDMSGAVTLDEGEVARLLRARDPLRVPRARRASRARQRRCARTSCAQRRCGTCSSWSTRRSTCGSSCSGTTSTPPRSRRRRRPSRRSSRAWTRPCASGTSTPASTTVIKNFLVSVPAVSELKSPAMRQRHWDKLMGITGASIAVADGKFDPAFCLADMLALQLHKFVDDVGEVVDQANKEDKMEQALKKLDETWKTVEFGFDKHQDTDVYLINLARRTSRCSRRTSSSCRA